MKIPGGAIWAMVLLTVGAVGARFARDRARVAPRGAVAWQRIWSVEAPGVVDVSLSSTGETLAWTDSKGGVRRIATATGRTLWRTFALTGVNRVVAAPNGSVAAFGAFNPVRNSVVLLDAATGDKNFRVWAGSGAVWGAAFGESSLFIGTGGGQGGVYELRNGVATKPRYLITGSPESLSVATSAERIAIGSWLPAWVFGCDLQKNAPCWRRKEAEPGRACSVAVSADGARVMILSVFGAKEIRPILRVHAGATGTVLWERRLPGTAAYPVARLSADGGTVAVTYRRTASPSDPDDWRLALFDARGNRLFSDKGSALFMPHLVAVSPDGGRVTVRSGDDTFYTISKRGDFVGRFRLPGEAGRTTPRRVLRSESTPDGKTVVLHLRGDKLVLLRDGAVK